METNKDFLSNLTYQDNFGYTLATPMSRLGGSIVQSLIFFIPVFLIFGWENYVQRAAMPGNEITLTQIGFATVLGAVLYPLWAGNLGHKLLGMKVISSEDGSDQQKPGLGALRELIKSIFGLFIIPSIWLLWDNKNQNLYDKVTKTLVVYRR